MAYMQSLTYLYTSIEVSKIRKAILHLHTLSVDAATTRWSLFFQQSNYQVILHSYSVIHIAVVAYCLSVRSSDFLSLMRPNVLST